MTFDLRHSAATESDYGSSRYSRGLDSSRLTEPQKILSGFYSMTKEEKTSYLEQHDTKTESGTSSLVGLLQFLSFFFIWCAVFICAISIRVKVEMQRRAMQQRNAQTGYTFRPVWEATTRTMRPMRTPASPYRPPPSPSPPLPPVLPRIPTPLPIPPPPPSPPPPPTPPTFDYPPPYSTLVQYQTATCQTDPSLFEDPPADVIVLEPPPPYLEDDSSPSIS